MKEIKKFKGDFEFLSNFYPSPIKHLGRVWPTAEHLYQGMKTLNPEEREKICSAKTPGKAKRLGRKVTLREDWDDLKFLVMVLVVKLKFEQNPDLAEKLKSTGNRKLIEGNNWHDNVWGDCSCQKCSGIEGDNFLGKILMAQRL